MEGEEDGHDSKVGWKSFFLTFTLTGISWYGDGGGGGGGSGSGSITGYESTDG